MPEEGGITIRDAITSLRPPSDSEDSDDEWSDDDDDHVPAQKPTAAQNGVCVCVCVM